MVKLKGLATGIGSLPHEDVSAAVDLVFKYVEHIPFWPQLPQRDFREGMLFQFSENLPCLRLIDKGLYFAPNEKELEEFYEKIIAQDLEYFKISQEFALGLHEFHRRLTERSLSQAEFLKGQITGPFTFAASIKDESGNALLHDTVFMQAILKGLIMKALWQIVFLKEFNKKMIVFVDEPYLGCFGSAYTPINREDVVKGLSELTEPIKSKDVLLGVHCCGNTDWSIFTDIKSIDIINFDAFGFLDKLVLYADNLKGFLKRGGALCWGIVPTQELTDNETVDLLIKKIKAGIDILTKKGLEKELLLDRLLLSPSCGLGTLDIKKSEEIFKLLSEISSSIRKTL